MNHLTRKARSVVVLLAAMSMLLVVPIGAAGALEPNVEGLSVGVDECEGDSGIFTLALEGSLEGCLYTDVVTEEKFGNGVFMDRGFETFVGCWDSPDGELCGTLSTSYVYTATFAPDGTQLTGGCTHPILSGTGDFAGASGILVFRDDVEAGTAEYRGVINLP